MCHDWPIERLWHFSAEISAQSVEVGCPCHLVHIAAENAAKKLPEVIDELLVGIYYYLNRSSKRLELLRSFQQLCDADTWKILEHMSICWLSLDICITRLLE